MLFGFIPEKVEFVHEVYVSRDIDTLLSNTGILSSIIYLSIIKEVDDLCPHAYCMGDSHVKHIRVIVLTFDIVTLRRNMDMIKSTLR